MQLFECEFELIRPLYFLVALNINAINQNADMLHFERLPVYEIFERRTRWWLLASPKGGFPV